MCADKEDCTAGQLRSRAVTARRLALQVTQLIDRERLLEFAAELDAKADRLERNRTSIAND
jgi:hypothetical protein